MSHARSRFSPALVVALVLVVALFYLVSRQSDSPAPQWQSSGSSQSTREPIETDADIIRKLDLSPTFEYRRQCIVAKRTKTAHRQSLVNVTAPLPSPAVQITRDDLTNQDKESTLFPPCEHSISVQVPHFEAGAHVDTSALLLGVATTLSRIDDSLSALSRWLSHTGTTLVVLVVNQPELAVVQKEIDDIQAKAEAAGIILTFEPYHSPKDSEGKKNFALAQALEKNKALDTKWFGVIDDDTFFLSLPRALDALEPYDSTQPYYIGALTERHYGVKKEGFKAWGGAGIFISPPLMKTLAENMDYCRSLDTGFGDILWRDCILEVTSPTVQLTRLAGLNQIDMWGDISGWYESGLNPLLTVHHWKSWHFHPVPKAHLVADVAGSETFLQRYKFADGTILTNGFSMVKYPQGLPDLDLAEATMVEDVGITRPPGRLEFHYSLGKTRPALEVGKEKVSWQFRHSTIGKDGSVRQFYLKRGNYNGGNGDSRSSDPIDSVIEISWSRG